MAEDAIRFTQRSVAEIPLPSSGRMVVRDSVTQGLYVQVSHTGVKSFYWYARVNGRPTRICLGRFPEMAVEAARTAVKGIIGDVASGRVPSHRRRAEPREMTLKQAFGEFFDNYSKPHKRTWRTDQKRFDRVLSHWQHRPLSQITTREITAHHVAVGRSAGPYAANRMLELLKTIYNYASNTLGWEGVNPIRGITKFQTEERDRFLSEDELRRFFAAIPKIRKQTPRSFILLCILTGARRSNIMAMEWSEIDFSAKTWTIPKEKSKSKRSMMIPLSDAAIELLRELKKGAKSRWVLPSHSAEGHYKWPREAWATLLKNAGITNLRIHDLRRTFGSYQAMAGASMLIISKSLGQSSTAATRIYARLQMDPVRASIEVATSKIMGSAQEKTEK